MRDSDSQQDSRRNIVVGVGSVESSFLYRNVPCIKDKMDPDHAPLLLYQQYMTQLEVLIPIMNKLSVLM